MAETETPTTSATTTPTATGDDLQLEQQVEITDKGPCLKHIKVTVPREIINRLLDQKLGELGRTVPVPGFRPGKAPAQLVRRYLEPQALEEIRPTLLLASLQQILEQHNLNPITTPNFDPLAVSIPKEGPLVYEFDLEVWPDFPLPTYKGMKLKRPVFQITDEILRNEREIFIRRRAGRLVKKEAAEPGDVIVGTLSVYRDGRKVGDFEVNLRVSDEVRFHDGVVRNFIPIIAGAKPKEERSFTIELFRSNRPQEITGTAQGTLLIKEIYTVQVPESLEEILQEVGCDSEEELMERVREALQARIDSTQREWLRSQIVTAWLQEVQPQLPASVLAQEYRRALSRRILELQRAGYTPEEIQRWQIAIGQQTIAEVAGDLYFQMIVQKIADTEHIEVDPEEVDKVVELLARVELESPRRVRARLEREGELENLAALLLQNKVLDFIIQHAEIEDVPAEFSTEVPSAAAEIAEDIQITEPETLGAEPTSQEQSAQQPASAEATSSVSTASTEQASSTESPTTSAPEAT